MTTSAIFWAAVGYANGLISQKRAFLGESYNREGNPRSFCPRSRPPRTRSRAARCRSSFLLPRWEIFQPGEYFRAFERGGIANNTFPPDIGNPNPLEEAGKPDIRLGNRGRGTGSRISPGGLINLHKTRLNDPHLVPRHERTSRRLPLVGLHRVSRRLRERSPSRCTADLATAGHTASRNRMTSRSRKTRRAIRSAISSRARCRRASACPAICTSPTPS